MQDALLKEGGNRIDFNLGLMLGGCVIILCILSNKISFRLGVPSLILFIGLGMLFGSDGLFRIPFENYQFAERLCTAALIYIMFYGGFGTRWKQAKPIAAKAVVLSSFGVFATALLTGLFCYGVLNIDLLESFLIGSVISSTDAASTFFILRSKKLALKENTDSLLEIESGSNDPFSYMLTVIMLTVMAGVSNPALFAALLLKQLVFGIAAGLAVAAAGVFCLNRLDFATEGFDAIFVTGLVLLGYALTSWLGGNGYLCVYIAGMIMGNVTLRNKRSLVHFFDGITGLMQILIFFLLGLLAFPSQLSAVMGPAVLIALFLTFIARPAAVFLILGGFRSSWRQCLLVSWAGLRGASSIVFAIMATVSPAYTRMDVYHMVFCIVLLSIAIQGTLLPGLARKLGMINEGEDVLKTFNDYKDLPDIEMIQLEIQAGHPWIGRQVKDLELPSDLLLAMIQRGGRRLIPKGATRIESDDQIVALAKTCDQKLIPLQLVEIAIDSAHPWCGRLIRELKLDEDLLIMMIQRGKTRIVPDGSTRIEAEDILVVNQPLRTRL